MTLDDYVIIAGQTRQVKRVSPDATRQTRPVGWKLVRWSMAVVQFLKQLLLLLEFYPTFRNLNIIQVPEHHPTFRNLNLSSAFGQEVHADAEAS